MLPTWCSGEPGDLTGNLAALPGHILHARSAPCLNQDQLCDQKEIGPYVRGSWPWALQAKECGVSFLGLLPFSLEACAHVALNVDSGKASGPECHRRLLGGTSWNGMVPLPVV